MLRFYSVSNVLSVSGAPIFLYIVFITGDLSQYIWYHGSIEKQVAKERLKGKEVRHVYS